MATVANAASRRWTLSGVILGSSMAFMDVTVVNVALPSIQSHLDATAAELQWVVEAYALFLSALLLVGGALGDRYGRKRLYALGTLVFLAGSTACALAPSPATLILARALQGIGGALLVPGSLSLLSAGFPEAERGRAIGTWSAFSAIAAAIGPVIGGLLVDHASWRWAFALNLPIGAVLLLVCLPRIPESRGDDRGPVDLAGAVAATVGLAGVVFALIEAPVRGWSSPPIVAAAVLGVMSLVAFVVVELRALAPMMPPGLFGNRDFAGANVLTFLLYAALTGSFYFVPLVLIQVHHYATTAAAAALLPFIVIMAALSRWTGSLVAHVGPRAPLVAGPAIAAAGFALFALPGLEGSYWSTFFPAVSVLGLGMSVTVAPLTTTVMNSVASQLAGTASGVNNAVSRTAGLLAIAALGAMLAAVFDRELHAALVQASIPDGLRSAVESQRYRLAATAPPAGTPEALASTLRHAVAAAFVAGFRHVMLVSAALALMGAACSWFLIGGQPSMPALDERDKNSDRT